MNNGAQVLKRTTADTDHCLDGSFDSHEDEIVSMVLKMGEEGCNIENVVRRAKEEMNRREILKKHKYKISYFEDQGGRWGTYIVDRYGNKKYYKRKQRKEIEDLIVKYANEGVVNEKATYKSLYGEWIKHKEIRATKATVEKCECCWNKYFADNQFINKEIAKVTIVELEEELIKIVKRFNLTSRKASEMKSLMNQLYDYAILKGIVTLNSARCLRGFANEKNAYIAVELEKDDSKEFYSQEEAKLLINACKELFEVHFNTAYLAIMMNFLLGLRVGEMAALKTSDFHFDECYVKLARGEVAKYVRIDGKMRARGFEVVPFLKMRKKERRVTIPDGTLKFFNEIVAVNKSRGFKSDWLFLSNTGNRLHKMEIMKALERANRRAGLPQRSFHKIRKTYVSKLVDAKIFSIAEIRDLVGHKDASTTLQYYTYSMSDYSAMSSKMKDMNIPLMPENDLYFQA